MPTDDRRAALKTTPEWIIVQRPGRVPTRKGPYSLIEDTAAALRELPLQYPDATLLVLHIDEAGTPRPTAASEYLLLQERALQWPARR